MIRILRRLLDWAGCLLAFVAGMAVEGAYLEVRSGQVAMAGECLAIAAGLVVLICLVDRLMKAATDG